MYIPAAKPDKGNFDKVTSLVTRVHQARSFINTELMEIPQDKINEFLKDKELQDYVKTVNVILGKTLFSDSWLEL